MRVSDIARPGAIPFGLVVNKSVNIFGMFSSVMLDPVSVIVIQLQPGSELSAQIDNTIPFSMVWIALTVSRT